MKSNEIEVRLSLEELAMIRDALQHSKRFLAPILGPSKQGATNTFNSTLDHVTHAIDVILRKRQQRAQAS